MDWIKQKFVDFFAPSFLNKYVAMGLRAAFLALGVYLKAHGADGSFVDQFLSPETASRLAEALVALALSMSAADKAKNQPIDIPKGEKIVAITTVPKSLVVTPNSLASPLATVTPIPKVKP